MTGTHWPRRTLLRALGGAAVGLPLLGGVGTARDQAVGDVETVVDFDGAGIQPENIAIDPRGNVFLTMGLEGEIRKLPASKVTDTGLSADDTEVVTTLDTGDGFLTGIVADSPRTLYVALASFASESDEADTQGVYEVDTDDGSATLLSEFPTSGLPNGVLRARRISGDQDGLLVSDSFEGTISRVAFDDGSRSTLVDDAALDPDGFIGTNGLAVDRDGDLFTVNLDDGTVIRVPIDQDGTAGDTEIVAEDGEALGGADGIVFDNDDRLYVAVNQPEFKIARVTQTGEVERLADSDDGLDTPSDVAFGKTTRGSPKELYVTNFPFRDESTDGELLRLPVGATGDVE